MPLETGTYISDLDASNPVGSTDKVQTLDDHVRLIKSTVKASFPGVTGAVTATHTELNALDGITASVAELNILDGVTLTAAQINDAALKSVSNTFTGDLTISKASASLYLTDTAGAVNEDIWRIFNIAGTLAVQTRTDANGAGTAAIQISRSGTTVTEIELNATTFDFNGAMDLSGALTLGGNLITASTLTIAGSGETLATFADDGAVTLYYDNASKLNTKTDGVNITGELECDTLNVDGNVAIDGTLTTPGSSAAEVGTAGVVQTVVSNTNYTLVLADRNRHIYYTGAGHTITIPANASVAFPIGTTVTFINRGSAAIDIAITSDTLELAGSGSGGTRSLASPGMATAVKVTTTLWLIAGTGLS